MTVLSANQIEKLLGEDVPYGDLTSEALGICDARGHIRFAARSAMTVAAIEEAHAMLALAGVEARLEAVSGQAVEAGATLLTGHGPAGGVLRAWKVAQTLVEIWSGVASATRRLVVAAQAARPGIVVACTRKNVPGTKALAVAAVKAGGGVMHRLGLSETVLVFPEHRVFRPGDDLAALARALKARVPEKKLVIEVNSVAEGVAAAAAGFEVIQMEKFAPGAVAALAAGMTRLEPRPVLAAAGGINPDNAADYVRAGADVLVTSWPYTARPSDVAVTITRAG
jgi:molybdenum transport protein